MRFKKIIPALFVTILPWMGMQAGGYIYMSGALGYAAHFDEIDQSKPAFGLGGAYGLGFEIHSGHFLGDIGLEAQYAYTTNKIENQEVTFRMNDTEGDAFTYIGRFSDRKDRSHEVNLKIPLMLGAQFGKFYFLAGGRVGLNVLGKGKSTADLYSMGDYDRFIDPFERMPNHGYSGQSLTSKSDLSYNLSAAVCAEIGLELGETRSHTGFSLIHKNRTTRYRVGLFAEYGVLNVHNNEVKGNMTDVTVSEYMRAQLNHVYLSTEAYKKSVVPFFAGVRFTMLFQLKERRRCVVCDLKEM